MLGRDELVLQLLHLFGGLLQHPAEPRARADLGLALDLRLLLQLALDRAREARVILRLLESGPQVLATGGGAFTNPDTRIAIGAKGISIWLKAELDVLMKRIKRRHDRPLLKTDDPGATLRKLMEERDPVYALADLTVQSREVMHEKIVDEIVSALAGRMGTACATPGAPADGGHEP